MMHSGCARSQGGVLAVGDPVGVLSYEVGTAGDIVIDCVA
jgi:hypothetical protein